jgi:threonine dehydratase
MFTIDELERAAAVVHNVLPETPQIRWPLLCQRVGADVWVKQENHTPTGAFKIRGALFYISELRRKDPGVEGVIAATRGNFGQSVAFAGVRSGLRTVIVVPHGNGREQNAAMRGLGAELIEFGKDFQDALEHAGHLAKESRLHFIDSFNLELVQGVASYALELFRGVPSLEYVYVPIGLGSGICGTIAARNALGLQTRIVGVVSTGAPAYALSFQAGKPVSTPSVNTMADGVSCRVPNPVAVDIINRNTDHIVTVSDSEIKEAMRIYFSATHNVAEGAAAAPLAALLREQKIVRNKRIALIHSGCNIDRDLFASILANSDGTNRTRESYESQAIPAN